MQVKNGLQAPYIYDGRAFQREQSVTKRMPQSKYDTLVAGRNQLNHSWESFIANDYNVELLDSNLILSTVRKGVEDKRLPEIALRQDIFKILETLDLSKEGSLNNAAVVLFGTKFTPNYPQCQLKLARFKGVDKHEFIDSDLIYGNLFDLLDKAMLFIKRHLPVAAKIEPGKLERTEKPVVPYDAIREAFINSLCHRDYNIRGGAISLAIYDNRMEIYNNGGLPHGVTIEKIKAGFSQHRNPLIADVCYKCRLTEKWGRGIQEIITSCNNAGDPEPEFIADETEFKVIFKFPNIRTDNEPLAINKSIRNMIAHGLFEPTSRRLEIIDILLQENELNINDIMAKLKDSPAQRTLRDDMAALKKSGIVGSRGRAKTAIWFIKDRTSL